MKNKDVIKTLAETNDPKYNLTKTIEELNELATVLMQLHNKEGGEKEPPPEDICLEIADVEIRIKILKKLFNKEMIEKLRQAKLDKYKGYIEQGLYKGKI